MDLPTTAADILHEHKGRVYNILYTHLLRQSAGMVPEKYSESREEEEFSRLTTPGTTPFVCEYNFRQPRCGTYICTKLCSISARVSTTPSVVLYMIEEFIITTMSGCGLDVVEEPKGSITGAWKLEYADSTRRPRTPKICRAL